MASIASPSSMETLKPRVMLRRQAAHPRRQDRCVVVFQGQSVCAIGWLRSLGNPSRRSPLDRGHPIDHGARLGNAVGSS